MRSLYQIHFGTPMGGLPSARLPVTLPNDLGLEPGEQTEIWYYDAAPFPGVPGAWRRAGLGTVSPDGTQIVSNPGVGIERFCGVCGLVGCGPPKGPTNNPGSPTGGEPVNLATGQFIVPAKTDLVLPGRLPLTLSRAYHPDHPFTFLELGLGRGWTLSVDVALIEVNASLRRLILPGNARFEFVRQPDGTFTNSLHPLFAGAVLTQTGTSHTLRFRDGATWRWAPAVVAGFGLLVEQADRTGNRLTIERDSSGRILRIVEAVGRAVEFTYTSGRVSQITDPLGRTVRYTYTPDRRLETVTDPTGGVTRYTYDGAGRITTITDPRNILFLRNTYSPGSGRILTQTQADGGIWRFRYALQGATVSGPGCPGAACPTEESTETVAAGYTFTGSVVVATTVTDPRGHPTTHRFTPTGFPREVTDALG